MAKKNREDKSEIKDVISKLVRTKRFSDLTKTEISLLSEFASLKLPDSKNALRKTLISWIWNNSLKYRRYIEHDVFSLSPLQSTFLPELQRDIYDSFSEEAMCTLFSRDELTLKITETLLLKDTITRDNSNKISGAVLLVGLAGFREFEQDIIDICLEPVDADEISIRYYWRDAMSTAFLSLIMLESKSLEKVVSKFISRIDDSFRYPLLLYYDMHPEQLSLKNALKFHDYLKEYSESLKFPDVLMRVFNNDLPSLNNLIIKAYHSQSDDVAWDVVCPAIYTLKNIELFEHYLSENNLVYVRRILLYAILNKADWILPTLRDKLADYSGPENLEVTGQNSDVMFKYILITAGFLTSGDCDWIRPFLESENTGIKVSAILSCIGKEQFLGEIEELMNNSDKLISSAAAFAKGLSEKSEVVHLESLFIEMEMSDLDLWIAPLIHAKMTSLSLPIPPGLNDLWFALGPDDYKNAITFYKLYPYRLYKWLFIKKDSLERSKQLINEDDSLLAIRFVTILKEIADESMIGMIKSLVYSTFDSADILALSVLLDLEQDDISIETTTLRKIFVGEKNSKLSFSQDEYPFAILYYVFGRAEKRSIIVKGFTNNSPINESFLRLLVETQNDKDIVNAAIDSIVRISEVHDPLLCEIIKYKKGELSRSLDNVSFNRLINVLSGKLRNKIAGSCLLPDSNKTKKQAYIDNSLTEKDINLLLFLFRECEEAHKSIVEVLAKNCEQIPWFKSTIRRWVNFKSPFTQSMNTLADLALWAAQIMKSEEYLPEFIKRLGTEYDTKVVFDSIEEIVLSNPESPILLLRADDPDRVVKIYDLSFKPECTLDNKQEATRIISIALGGLADRKFAEKNIGKNVSINHEKENIDPTLIQKCLTKKEFEKIALYLSVNYTDNTSGLIFAEVVDPSEKEPSSEIINAILQSSEYAIFTVSWC